MTILREPDTRFGSYANQWPVPTGVLGGRVLADGPHTDGVLIASGSDLDVSGVTASMTRGSVGVWYLAATGAGTVMYFRANLSEMVLVRTGETQVTSTTVVGSSYSPPLPDKGLQVTNMFVIWNLAAVPAPATLRLGQTQYAAVGASTVPVQTDIQAATAIPGLVITTGGQFATQVVPVTTPVFDKADLCVYEMELAITMTGALQLVAIGCHCNFNFN